MAENSTKAETSSRLRGLVLCAIGVVATLCLAFTGRLELYIHPRYVVFTVIMAVLGCIALAVSPWVRRRNHSDHESRSDHADHSEEENRPRSRTAGTAAGWALTAVALVALLVVPPATLSAQRAVATGVAAAAAPTGAAPVLLADPSTMTIDQWASLLQSGATATDLADAQANVTGFVLRDPEIGDDLVFVGRYHVTCCVVDAQVVVMPVQSGEWSENLADGDWVQVVGTFVDIAGPVPTVLVAEMATPTDEPADPYIFF